MKKTTRIIALLLSTVLLLSAAAMAASVKVDTDIPMVDVKELTADLKKDQTFTLADPAPWNLEELKQVVNVKDPRSVAAYFVWAVNRLVWLFRTPAHCFQECRLPRLRPCLRKTFYLQNNYPQSIPRQ